MKRLYDRYAASFDVDPERLWRALSDTDALQRDAGFPPVTYRSQKRAGGPNVATASARIGPFAIAWEERPFEWEAPHRWSVERIYRGGPFAHALTALRVSPASHGARVEQFFELDVRTTLGRLLAPLLMMRARSGAQHAFRIAADRARTYAPAKPTRETVAEVPPTRVEDAARFVDALAALRPQTSFDGEIAARLASYIAHGDRTALAYLRPYVLADAWELPRERVLAVMLAAADAGLLDLTWRTVCSCCRNAGDSAHTLAELRSTVHCDACGADYRAEFDRNVEVMFDGRPCGRGDAPAVYCMAGPHAARQSHVQAIVPAGGSVELDLPLAPGAYVLQAPPGRAARFVAEEDAGAATLAVTLDQERARAESSVVNAGHVRVTVHNTGPEAVVRISEAELSDQLATAAAVTALQPFRDLFSSELLAVGTAFDIRSLTMLCSSGLGADTAYPSVDDALHDLVSLHRGALVEKSGAAALAVFAHPGDAVRAARAMLSAAKPLLAGIGLHSGPCSAVRAAGCVDYVGAAIELAARVGEAAAPGEILVSEAVFEDARAGDLRGEAGTLQVDGRSRPIATLRLNCERYSEVGA